MLHAYNSYLFKDKGVLTSWLRRPFFWFKNLLLSKTGYCNNGKKKQYSLEKVRKERTWLNMYL